MQIFRPTPITLSVLLSLSLWGCQQASDQGKSMPPAEVGVVSLEPQAVTINTELSGRVVAQRTAEIRPQVTGIVLNQLFQEGSTVKAGQALYQLDPASYEATVRNNQATVSKSEAAVAVARQAANRSKALLEAGAGSIQDDETAQSTLQQALATLEASKASLASAELDLAHTRITSPIGGRIDTSSVTVGALVTANQTTALTTVSQVDPVMVNISQSSAELLSLQQKLKSGRFKKGELKINLLLENGTQYAHAGKLKVEGVSVDTATGTITLRAEFPNPEGQLLPGMYVRAVLGQLEDPQALLLPQTAVSRNNHGEPTVLVVGADGKASERTVQLDQVINGQWHVVSGLQKGERVVVQGNSKVRDGQIVRAVDTQSSDKQAPATDKAPQSK